MMRAMVMVVCLLLSSLPVMAKEIAGVSLTEKGASGDGVELTLNGAGVRSKLFIKVYVAGLYLEHPTSDAAAVLAGTGRRQMQMHFLYDKVEKEKLIAAWMEGFEGNLTQDERKSLDERIGAFNAMFDTVKKGDSIVLDYIPDKGTSVTVAGAAKGVIEGKDFGDALFAIWLGKKPVTEDLKKALLAQN